MTDEELRRMLAEATPGPWSVEDKWNVCGAKYQVANGSTMVVSDDESEANARLIAAAPDLAAEVLTLRAQLDSTLKDRAMIRAERDRTFALMLERAERAEAALTDIHRLLERAEAVVAAAKRLRSAVDRQRNTPRGVSVEVHDAIAPLDAAIGASE